MVGLLGGRAYGCGSCERGQLLPRLKKASDASSTAAIAVPFHLAFSKHDRWEVDEPSTYLETVVDLFFLADIVRNFRTAFYDRGNLVTDAWRIARQYARTWLLVDVVASFPLDWFAAAWATDGDDEGGDSSQTQLLRNTHVHT